jgi:hypothetical protein
MRGRLGRAGVLLAAAVLTAALARSTTSAAFSDVTGDAGDSVTASNSFCVAKGTTSTVVSAGDSWTDEASPGTTHAGDLNIYVRSSSAGDRRTWVRFTLPTPPTHCTASSAVLSLYARTTAAGRTIDVYRGAVAPVWTSAAITWTNQPAAAGTAVGSASLAAPGWQSWTVTAHVQDQYANGNNGFLLRDRTENAGVPVEQMYDTIDSGATAPTLVVTWG